MLVLFVVSVAGCQRMQLTQPADPDAGLPPLQFPEEAPLGDDLDIVVIRDRRTIMLANRTPRSYTGHMLWLNREYVARINAIGVGTGNRGELLQFRNHHGESYPVATLLAPDRSERLVSADLIEPVTGRRHRLTVRTEPE